MNRVIHGKPLIKPWNAVIYVLLSEVYLHVTEIRDSFATSSHFRCSAYSKAQGLVSLERVVRRSGPTRTSPE
jgi:hypothetical protein